MVEIIPALKKLHHPDLYPRDFYLNFVQGLMVHERSFFLYFLYFTGGIVPIILMLIYCCCLFFFIFGLFKLFQTFISNILFQLYGILIVLFALKYTSIGGNELFYSMPTSAIFAKTLCVWAIYFFLKEKRWISYSLIILASYFHVLVGVQIFIILSLVDLISNYKRIKFWKLAKPILVYALCIAPYVLALILSRQNPHTHDNKLVDLVEFRIGHHFFIQYSSLGSIVLYCIIFIAGLFLWNKENKIIARLYWIQAIILILYLVFGNLFRNEYLLQFQWLKTTIWIELLTTIILVKKISESLQLNLNLERKNALIAFGFISVLTASRFTTKENTNSIQEETQLAQWAKDHTDISALFVYSPYFTRFKTVSERSSWIDYKAIAHQKAYLIPWADRVQKIFEIGLQDRRNGSDLVHLANENYSKISDEKLAYLFNEQNVDYVILPTRLTESSIMTPVYSSEHYSIYKKRISN